VYVCVYVCVCVCVYRVQAADGRRIFWKIFLAPRRVENLNVYRVQALSTLVHTLSPDTSYSAGLFFFQSHTGDTATAICPDTHAHQLTRHDYALLYNLYILFTQMLFEIRMRRLVI